jgi:diguanylate cyclase (GGDEF)-like protein/PAS domain S-box-containing protein
MLATFSASVYSILLLLTAGLAIMVSIFAWRRRSMQGSLILSMMMIAVAEWALASSFEISTVNLSTKILWAQISYLGIQSIPPLFLTLALQYNQNHKWLAPRRLLIVWLLPLIIIGLAFTNKYHNFIWENISLNPDNPSLANYVYGAAFWVSTVYNYAIILIASWNMIWAAQNLSNLYRRQVGAIVIAAALPWIGNIIYFLNLNPLPGQGLTSITFMLMGTFLAWSMYRHQLFNFTPIARKIIVDKLSEAVIYINNDLIITDLNPASRVLLKADKKIIGAKAEIALEKLPYLATIFRQEPNADTYWRNIQDQDANWYDLRISPFLQQDQIRGWLVILRDITEQKELETALRASEELYRNVTEKANDGIAIIQDHQLIYCNPQLAALIGREIEDLVGHSFLDLMPPEYAKHVQERHIRRMRGEAEPTRYESFLLHASGDHVPVEFNVNIMDLGSKPALLAIVRDITEQVKTEKILLEHIRNQKLINDITLAAIESSELSETLQILANRLGELIHADGCYITLWSEESQSVIPAAASGRMQDTYKRIIPKPDEPTISATVLLKQEPIIIDDLFDSPHITIERAEEFPTRSLLALPLIADGQKLGAALIGFNTQHTFSEKEIALGEQASRQVALAILKARLLDTAQQRAKEAETLREAGAAVAATLKLDEAIDSILEQLNQVVPYDSASVQLLQDGMLEIVGQHGFKDPDSVLGMTFAPSEDNPNSIVLDQGKTHIIKDAPKAYQDFNKEPHNHIHGWMGVPLIVQDRVIGMLALDSNSPNRFNPEHSRLVSAFAAQVAIALDNANLYEETHRLAIMDSLTGIYNRRQFMVLAQLEMNRAARYQRPLSIVMMDIDHFKRVNDNFGHLIGDQVLHGIAQICQQNLREIDIFGRYGGEEFAILLPETPSFIDAEKKSATKPNHDPSAKAVAERLCQLVHDSIIETNKGPIKITASFGVVGLSHEAEKIETLLDRADTALYVAKQRGRNQVAVWTEIEKKT